MRKLRLDYSIDALKSANGLWIEKYLEDLEELNIELTDRESTSHRIRPSRKRMRMSKKISLLLILLVFGLTACGASIEGAIGKCDEISLTAVSNDEFSVCLSMDDALTRFNSGPHFSKAIVLGRLAIFNSGISEANSWYDGFRDEVNYQSEIDGKFMDSLWNAEIALKEIEKITSGDERWDELIGTFSAYSEASKEYNLKMSNWFNLNTDKKYGIKKVADADIELARTQWQEATSNLESAGSIEFTKNFAAFMSWLRSETGLTNAQAGRVALDYLEFSDRKQLSE